MSKPRHRGASIPLLLTNYEACLVQEMVCALAFTTDPHANKTAIMAAKRLFDRMSNLGIRR